MHTQPTLLHLRSYYYSVKELDFFAGEENIVPWMVKTMKCVDAFVSQELAAGGVPLSRKQMVVLKIIYTNGPLPQNDLAFVTDRDKASLTRFINTLEKKNLVARIPSKDDKRVNLIHLTKQGEKLLKDNLPMFQNIAAKMHKGISMEDRKVVIDILRKIQENTKK